jgi:hypothetical protein
VNLVVEGGGKHLTWSIADKWGDELVSGGAPFKGGTCGTPDDDKAHSRLPSQQPTESPLGPGETQAPTPHPASQPHRRPTTPPPTPPPSADATGASSAHSSATGAVVVALVLTAACGGGFAFYWWWAKTGLKLPDGTSRLDADHAARLTRYRNQGSEPLWPRDDRSGGSVRDGADEVTIYEAHRELPREASRPAFNSMGTIVHSSAVGDSHEVYASLGDDEL